MGIRKTPRFLAGVSAIAMLGAAGCGSEDNAASNGAGEDEAATSAEDFAAQAGEGEGEGSGEPSGGEMGIDPVAAERDPVVYFTALEVMRAHYLAGIDAIEAGQRSAGAEMFAHPISEIYIDLQPALEALGVDPFIDELTMASRLPYQGASRDEIAASVEDVLSAIDAAEEAAPSAEDMAQVRALVLSDLVERAALQYEYAVSENAPEGAYLDGYGFYKTAERWLEAHRGEIASSSSEIAGAADEAVAKLAEAFPAVTRPEERPIEPSQAASASQTLKTAIDEN